MALTMEQRAARATGLGASEIAAALGLHPYQHPIDIYNVKTGLVPPFEGNQFTRWGNRLESVIADAYAEEQKVVLTSPGTLVHPEHPWMLCTPDRFVHPADFTPPIRGLEIKTAGARQAFLWGEVGDEVPEQYLIQCAWSMAVTGLMDWDLAVLIGGNDDRVYHLHRDMELEASLIEQGRKFWFENVLARVPPPLDASPGWSKYLKARFPQNTGPMLEADAHWEEMAAELKAAKKAEEEAKERKGLAETAVKLALGESVGVEGGFGRITWKWQKGSTYSVTREPGRVLRTTWED